MRKNKNNENNNKKTIKNIKNNDCLFGIGLVVRRSDCHPRGPGFDSPLCFRNLSGSRPIGSGTGYTQPREDNWVARPTRYEE